MDDSTRLERAVALELGRSWLAVCIQIWVCKLYGVSEGMKLEIEYATTAGIPTHEVKLEDE